MFSPTHQLKNMAGEVHVAFWESWGVFSLPTQKLNSCDSHLFWCLSGNCWEWSCFKDLCVVVTWRGNSGKEIYISAVTKWIKWDQVLLDFCCPPSNVGRVVSYLLAEFQVLPPPNKEFPKCLVQVLPHSQMGSVRPKVRHQLECMIKKQV